MKRVVVAIILLVVFAVNNSSGQSSYAPGGTYNIDTYPGTTLQISVIGDGEGGNNPNPWTSDRHGVIPGIVLTVPGPDCYSKVSGDAITTNFFI
jgi:hypothetical protein